MLLVRCCGLFGGCLLECVLCCFRWLWQVCSWLLFQFYWLLWVSDQCLCLIMLCDLQQCECGFLVLLLCQCCLCLCWWLRLMCWVLFGVQLRFSLLLLVLLFFSLESWCLLVFGVFCWWWFLLFRVRFSLLGISGLVRQVLSWWFCLLRLFLCMLLLSRLLFVQVLVVCWVIMFIILLRVFELQSEDIGLCIISMCLMFFIGIQLRLKLEWVMVLDEVEICWLFISIRVCLLDML